MDIKKLSYEHPIIVFDGVCNLCNGFVQWIIKHDKERIFRYTTLDNDNFINATHSMNKVNHDTVMLIINGEIFIESDVSMEVFQMLPYPYKILSILRWIPKYIRDKVYRWIARNRYRWFGKRDACMIPTAEENVLFLSGDKGSKYVQ